MSCLIGAQLGDVNAEVIFAPQDNFLQDHAAYQTRDNMPDDKPFNSTDNVGFICLHSRIGQKLLHHELIFAGEMVGEEFEANSFRCFFLQGHSQVEIC
jgi:hypothetical protein